MKTIAGIEVGIVAAVVLVVWVAAPAPERQDGRGGPMLVMTMENGKAVSRPQVMPRALVVPYLMTAGAFLGVVVPLVARGRERGESA